MSGRVRVVLADGRVVRGYRKTMRRQITPLMRKRMVELRDTGCAIEEIAKRFKLPAERIVAALALEAKPNRMRKWSGFLFDQ